MLDHLTFDLLSKNFNNSPISQPKILHKLFRNMEDVKNLEGQKYIRKLLSYSNLDDLDINGKKGEMSQVGEGGLCESYGINVQRMRDIRKILGRDNVKWFTFL